MRQRYRHLDPSLLHSLIAGEELMALYQQLLLAAAGDPEQALEWLRELQRRGLLAEELDLDAFERELAARDLLQRDDEGTWRLSGPGGRRLRRSALDQVFGGLRKGGPGYHRIAAAGAGTETLPETRPWQFGDDVHGLDALASLRNTLRRTGGGLDLAAEDLEVHETEHQTSCATVMAIDISHSMVLYGEDRITPARTVALAMAELITTRYPKDSLDVVLFGDEARRIPLDELPTIDAGPFHTNTQAALRMARGLLERRRQPNRQIVLITDGKPSAVHEGGRILRNPVGLDLRIVNRTLEEVDRCRRRHIGITTFMLATDPLLVEFVDRLTRMARGRAYFASPTELGTFVLSDYLRHRHRRLR